MNGFSGVRPEGSQFTVNSTETENAIFADVRLLYTECHWSDKPQLKTFWPRILTTFPLCYPFSCESPFFQSREEWNIELLKA